MDKTKLRFIILTALIAAMCAIGSFIKIPVGVVTTAALDSAPAFISAIFYRLFSQAQQEHSVILQQDLHLAFH